MQAVYRAMYHEWGASGDSGSAPNYGHQSCRFILETVNLDGDINQPALRQENLAALLQVSEERPARSFAASLSSSQFSIDDLPLEIYWMICSCLPARDMVATSSISRSWVRQWAPPTHLRFSDHDLLVVPGAHANLGNEFARLVTNFLDGLDRRPGLREDLKCIIVHANDGRGCSLHLEKWVQLAKQWGVQQLEFEILRCPSFWFDEDSFMIPSLKTFSLKFRSENRQNTRLFWGQAGIPPLLESLHLDGFNILPFPFPFPFPSMLPRLELHDCSLPSEFLLEHMYLRIFVAKNVSWLNKLTIFCTVLEDFTLDNSVYRHGKQSLSLVVPMVQSFSWIGFPLKTYFTTNVLDLTHCQIDFAFFMEQHNLGIIENGTSLLVQCLDFSPFRLTINENTLMVLKNIVDDQMSKGGVLS